MNETEKRKMSTGTKVFGILSAAALILAILDFLPKSLVGTPAWKTVLNSLFVWNGGMPLLPLVLPICAFCFFKSLSEDKGKTIFLWPKEGDSTGKTLLKYAVLLILFMLCEAALYWLHLNSGLW